ncbi:hypothetical protein DACRYDRAFT_24898, partial [Dacryopinax primogenitus]
MTLIDRMDINARQEPPTRSPTASGSREEISIRRLLTNDSDMRPSGAQGPNRSPPSNIYPSPEIGITRAPEPHRDLAQRAPMSSRAFEKSAVREVPSSSEIEYWKPTQPASSRIWKRVVDPPAPDVIRSSLSSTVHSPVLSMHDPSRSPAVSSRIEPTLPVLQTNGDKNTPTLDQFIGALYRSQAAIDAERLAPPARRPTPEIIDLTSSPVLSHAGSKEPTPPTVPVPRQIPPPTM